jgi:hypothetical protein
MPGGYPPLGHICNPVQYGTLGFPVGTSIPPNASANTKGSWTQLTAATTQECCFLDLMVCGRPTGTRTCLSVDIGVGAAASEVIIISDFVVSFKDSISINRIALPINIPVGTRVSARSQCAGTLGSGTICGVAFWTYHGDYPQGEGYSGVDAIGFVSGSTQGTTITPSASASVKGSYSQLTAATTRDYAAVFAIADHLNAAYFQDFYWFDIAIGAAASEQIIMPNFVVYQYDQSTVCPQLYPIQIPSGTRLSARCAVASAGEPPIGLTLYGVYR